VRCYAISAGADNCALASEGLESPVGSKQMRSLLANRKLLKRKLIDIENHICGTLRAYGLLIGAVGRGATKHASGNCSSMVIQYFLR
jgi:hypothetical protein